MKGSKDIPTNAKMAMLEGARPFEMWTPIAILTQIKRMMPVQVYEIAKERYKAGFTLKECISPLVYKICRWRDYKIKPLHVLSPYRTYLYIGREDLAKHYKVRKAGMEFDITDTRAANKAWGHREHV